MTAAYISDEEPLLLTCLPSNSGVLPTDQIIFIGVEAYGLVWIASEREYFELVGRKFFDLLRFGTTNMPDNDAPNMPTPRIGGYMPLFASPPLPQPLYQTSTSICCECN